jgi:hypothetical protein
MLDFDFHKFGRDRPKQAIYNTSILDNQSHRVE